MSGMTVGIKDSLKLIGISITALCAVFVCNLFLNYQEDIIKIEDMISPEVKALYEAQVMSGKVTCLVSGGCLTLTAVVMLIFYIKNFVDTRKKDLGILKAMGYSRFEIAKGFSGFGLSVFIGTALGYIGSLAIMPKFYEVQNKDKLFPDISVSFHPAIAVCLVLLPTVAFAVLAVVYGVVCMKKPVISLLKDSLCVEVKSKKLRPRENDRSFLGELKSTTIRSKKLLAFFVILSAFCFSSMTQMSFSMKDLADPMMAIMMIVIGLVLAFTTMLLSLTSVIKGNTKSIAMMKALGYSRLECKNAILDCYRPLGYVGFVIGTAYQYLLLRFTVNIVFKDVAGIPSYSFDWKMMIISLVVYTIVYEAAIAYFAGKVNKVSVKEIMLEN